MEFSAPAGQAVTTSMQTPETTAAWRSLMDEIAPGSDEWVMEAVFGGTYQRPGFAARDRQLLTIAALTALGGVERELQGHFASSLRLGMSPAELGEALVHLMPYVGVPRTLAAMRLLKAAIAEVN